MSPAIAPILARRSVRAFTGQPVDEATLTSLLEAAMAAPSARAKDPWHFVVVRDPARLAAIAAILPYGKMLPAAGLGIVACGDREAAHRGSEGYLLQDVGAAIENLLLAASMLALGAVWLGVHPVEERVAGLRELLALPPPVLPVAAIAVGHPAEHPPPRTRYDAAKVHRERW